jgi:uncharacterized protein involved in exopolysaccharide biosynthesis
MLFIFKTLVSWRKFIVTATFLTAVVVAGISLLLPKWFTAATSIFPPEQSGATPLYAELLQNMQMPLLGPMGTGARPETIFIDMMKSRYIGERLIDEFDLAEEYKAGIIEDALTALHSHTGFTLLENGIVIVSFEDKDPQRAADVANRYVELLDEFNRELSVTRASKTKEFIERQMQERRAMLAEAELELKYFQEENEALELSEQLRAAMTIVTELTTQAIALETELNILEHYTSPTSDEFLQKKRQYDEVVEQLEKLKLNDGDDERDLLHAYLPTLEEIPELALELVRLKRMVGIETSVYTMLLKEYEKSRFEEARDTPTVQVMDRAAVPNLRSRPKRKTLVIIGALVGLGWSAFLALLITVWRENRERSRVFTDVVNPIADDFSRVFRRKK